tara:strand:- start:96 stop:413 length:318 start_codon:yes stop_codon:yes gene_type:complete
MCYTQAEWSGSIYGRTRLLNTNSSQNRENGDAMGVYLFIPMTPAMALSQMRFKAASRLAKLVPQQSIGDVWSRATPRCPENSPNKEAEELRVSASVLFELFGMTA